MSAPGPACDTIPLVELLELEQIERDLFRSIRLYDGRLYGGQVVAQALTACGATVDADRYPHSLHAYFLRAGDPARPVVYRIHRDRDGRSFSARRVEALQGGKPIFTMSASFHVDAGGPERQFERVAPLPAPADCVPIRAGDFIAIEARSESMPGAREYTPKRFWARPNCTLPADRLAHAAALAYLSDFSAGLDRHEDTTVLGPSVDHAIWFHRPFRWADWVGVEYGAGVVAGMRGWYTGTLFDADGVPAASMAQEMVYRPDRIPQS